MILLAFTSIAGIAQTVETFTSTGAVSSSYTARGWTGDNGLPWTATDARNDLTITGPAMTIRNGNITCNNIPNGISTLSFKHQQQFTGTGSVLEVRVNGNLIGTASPTTSVQTASFTGINIPGTFNLEIKQVTTGLRIAIDDVSWAINNTTPCATPSAQPTGLTFSRVTNDSIVGSFTSASPVADEYLTLISTSNTLTAMPANGTTYSDGDVVGNATVVSGSNTTAFTATSLNPGTVYYFYIFSFNSACSGGPLYNVTSPLSGSTATTTPPACATPTTTPGALALTPANTSVNGSFGNAAGADGYLVIRSNSGSFTFTPSNGTSYTVGQTVGSGTGTVIKSGAGNTFSSTGLTANTTYYFYVYAVSGFNCTGGPLYNATNSNASTTTTTGGTGEPASYYNNAIGKSCEQLKTALKTITTSNMNARSYGDLWNQYTSSDIKPREVGSGSANVIWDIYSDIPGASNDPYNFTPVTNQCGNYSIEGQCYNREHSFPQNWFTTGTATGPGTDYHHIYPTDGKVNGVRSNYIYGEVATASFTSLNGSKLGNSAFAGINGTVFEPINEYKGDLARAFLYMVTRYEDNMPTWGNLSSSNGLQALEPNTFPSVDVPYLKLMIKWHNQDAVSQKEIDRNNAAYSFQNNRNPFVDHPEYVNQVWNSSCSTLSALPVDILSFGGRLVGNVVKLEWIAENEQNFDRFEIERSNNGTDYNKIGEVKAAGIRSYSFNDGADALSGMRVYYRLKKIDKDGKYKYSSVLSLHIPLNTRFTVSPNPANNYVQLQMNRNVNGNVFIRLTDISGRVMQQQNVTVSGSSIRLNTSSLTGGTYLVKLIYNGEEYIQKVVISK